MAKLTASFTALLEMLAPVIRSTCWSRVMVSAGRPVYWAPEGLVLDLGAHAGGLALALDLHLLDGAVGVEGTMTTTVELYPLSLLVMMVPTPLSAV